MFSSPSIRALHRHTLVSLTVCFALCFGARQGAAQSLPSAPSSAAKGKVLYARYCQLCHAEGGSGYAADHAPSLVSAMFLTAASDAFIARGTRFGRPNTAMAAYGKSRGGPLDDASIDAIVAYLRSLGPQAIALPEVKGTGNVARGATLFERRCSSCHGSSKQRGEAPDLRNPEFLAAASPAFLRHSIRHGRPPTRMPAFEKKLSAVEIEDLVAWLGSLPTEGPAAPRTPPDVIGKDLPLLRYPKGAAPQFTLREDRFVSAEQVKQALEAKQRFVIVDARAPSDWLQEHLPGALPMPYYDTAKLDRIPNDGTWVVAYCACPHHASGAVVDALRQRNYPHTAVLDEGILFWRDHGFPVEGEAAARMGAPATAPVRP